VISVAEHSYRDTILVLTQQNEPHSDLVLDQLSRRGVPAIRFQTEDFPRQAAITCRTTDQEERQTLTIDGEDHDLATIRTVWNRRPGPLVAVVSNELDGPDRQFAIDECSHLLKGLWAVLSDRFWVNKPEATAQASLKPSQLAVARQLGFTVPRTLMTNRPDQLRSFFDECDGQIIYKGFSAHMRVVEGRTVGIYTNRLTKNDIAKCDSIRFAPGIFQEYVPKRVELRITVIGTRALAAEIHSQNSERSRDDWRRYDFGNTPYCPHPLPMDVEARCVRLVRSLGLVFGCIDMIVTPDSRYVFLEINPNGQWYWIEQLTGMPLLDHFVEMLIQATPNYAMTSSDEVAKGTIAS
jgi:hypothetical protein